MSLSSVYSFSSIRRYGTLNTDTFVNLVDGGKYVLDRTPKNTRMKLFPVLARDCQMTRETVEWGNDSDVPHPYRAGLHVHWHGLERQNALAACTRAKLGIPIVFCTRDLVNLTVAPFIH